MAGTTPLDDHHDSLEPYLYSMGRLPFVPKKMERERGMEREKDMEMAHMAIEQHQQRWSVALDGHEARQAAIWEGA